MNFAWALNQKTIVRGGYDIFYSNAFASINSPGQSAANSPGWNQEYDWQGSFYPNECAPFSGQCVAFPLSDTTIDKGTLTTPQLPNTFPGAKRDPLIGIGLLQFFTPPPHDPMVQSWNLQIERELPANMMVSVGYVGSHGTHLVGEPFRQFNYVHTRDRLKYRTTIDANIPITDVYSGKTATLLGQVYAGPDGVPVTELPRSLLLKDYPFYGALSSLQNNTAFDGTSIYHGLNVRLQKRYSRGLSFIAAYTFSKKITNASTGNTAAMLVDPIHWARNGNLGGRALGWNGGFGGNFQDIDNKTVDRAIAADDIPHMFNLAVTYELPIGNGKPLLNRKGALNAILGGWRLTNNFNAQSGLPLAIGCPSNELTGRCNLIGDPKTGSGDGLTSPYFNVIPIGSPGSAFGRPAKGTFGNLGRNELRGPGWWNVDASLFKRFQIKGESKLELRVEAQNVFNHINRGNPDSEIGVPGNLNPNSGFITSMAANALPRNLQFGVRLLF